MLYGHHTILNNAVLYHKLNTPKQVDDQIQLRKLMLITEVVDEIVLIKGEENIVADALSRMNINSISFKPAINYAELFYKQQADDYCKSLTESDDFKKITKFTDNQRQKFGCRSTATLIKKS
jgi:hypothetical protein